VGLATALNSLPLLLATLPTDTSVPAYLADQLGAYAGTAMVLAATVIVAGMAGEALVWTAEGPGDKKTRRQREQEMRQSAPASLSPLLPISLSRALTLRGLASATIVRGLLIGLCVGVAQLGYVTLFYWIGQRWFGVWAPVDPNYDDALSTPLPWLYAIALGLLPAVGEELVFRLGGISLLRRATGMPRLAVVTTAVIWASLHTTYSQQPFFIRLVELTIVGIMFGALFLRYGVISSMAAHYTYNAALMAPLLAQGTWPTRIGMLLAVGGAALLLLPALVRWRRGQPLEGAEALVAALSGEWETWRQEERELELVSSPLFRVSLSETRLRRRLPVLAITGLAAWLLAIWLLPLPPLLDRPLSRAGALAQAQAWSAELGLPTSGLFGAAYPDATLLGLDAGYLRDYPGTSDIREVVASEGARASWRVRFSQWDRDDTLALWLGTYGELVAFDRSLPEDASGQAIGQAQARDLAAGLLRRQGVDVASAALVESSTITRTNRVDHRFIWQGERVIGEAAYPRVLVALQGDQVATLSPYLYTPPEYRRARDRTTILRLIERDAIPLLPMLAALLLSGAGLLLSTRRPPPLRLIVAAGLVGAGVALGGGLLRLDAAQQAQPPRLLQGVTYAIYSAILAGAELGLIAGGAAMLWARAFPTAPSIDAQFGISAASGQDRQVHKGFQSRQSFSLFSAFSAFAWPSACLAASCALALSLLPGLLAFGALRAGLGADPGAVRSPGGLDSFLPAATVLLEGAGAALRSALLLAGVTALLAIWRSLRPLALPLATLGALLVAAHPDRPSLLVLVLVAWPIVAWLAWHLLWPERSPAGSQTQANGGNIVALFLALGWAACLPDALELFALDQWWYAANGALAILLLIAPILLLREPPGASTTQP
ncbi:MAG TPA: CPBP family intramembrane glutamic endopeptidase, partial [Roseiflexaceae bacterium]|nr:CPBP family intramembrane glutamic endopeptidase [Roseiflexaceae bacterium]